MGLLVGLMLAIIVPFLLFLEWNIFVWLGADYFVASLLTTITTLICFASVVIDTDCFEDKSTFVKWLESQKDKVG